MITNYLDFQQMQNILIPFKAPSPPNNHLIILSIQAQGLGYDYLNNAQLWMKHLKCISLAMASIDLQTIEIKRHIICLLNTQHEVVRQTQDKSNGHLYNQKVKWEEHKRLIWQYPILLVPNDNFFQALWASACSYMVAKPLTQIFLWHRFTWIS